MKIFKKIFLLLCISAISSANVLASELNCKSHDDGSTFKIFFDNKNLVSTSIQFPFGSKFFIFLAEDDIYLVYQDTPLQSLYDNDIKFSNLIKINKNNGELTRNLRIKEVAETKQNPTLKFKKDVVSYNWVTTEKDFKYQCK